MRVVQPDTMANDSERAAKVALEGQLAAAASVTDVRGAFLQCSRAPGSLDWCDRPRLGTGRTPPAEPMVARPERSHGARGHGI